MRSIGRPVMWPSSARAHDSSRASGGPHLSHANAGLTMMAGQPSMHAHAQHLRLPQARPWLCLRPAPLVDMQCEIAPCRSAPGLLNALLYGRGRCSSLWGSISWWTRTCIPSYWRSTRCRRSRSRFGLRVPCHAGRPWITTPLGMATSSRLWLLVLGLVAFVASRSTAQRNTVEAVLNLSYRVGACMVGTARLACTLWAA